MSTHGHSGGGSAGGELMSAAKRPREAAEKQKSCSGCRSSVISEKDKHDRCAYCLGWEHVKNGVMAPDACPACAVMDESLRRRRLQRVEKSLQRDPPPERSEEDRAAAAYARRHPSDDQWPSHILHTGYDGRAKEVHSRLGAKPRTVPVSTVTTRAPFTSKPREEARYVPPHYDDFDATPLPQAADWDEEMVEDDDGEEVPPAIWNLVDQYDLHEDHDYEALGAYPNIELEFPEEGEGPYRADLEENTLAAEEAEAEEAPGVMIQPAARDAERLELYKQAALRCERKWPPAIKLRPASSVRWQGQKEEPSRAPEKHALPFAEGCREVLTLPWEKPTAPHRPGRCFSLDTEEPESAGLTGIPPIRRELAGYLVNPYHPHYFPMGKPVDFSFHSDPRVQKASKANKELYGHLVAQAKGLNAHALLQGSLQVLLSANEVLDNDNMMEARRVMDEMIAVSRGIGEATGRAMANSIVQERTRWLDVRPTPAGMVRSLLLDRPISTRDAAEGPLPPPDGLFHGGMKELVARGEEKKRSSEAMHGLREPARPPPPLSRPPQMAGVRDARSWRFKSERGRSRMQEEVPAAGRGRGRAPQQQDRPADPHPPQRGRGGRGVRGRGRGRAK